jgi:uncharacterized protein YbjT (DUF2867 family)
MRQGEEIMQARRKIAVVGGTGRVGSQTVDVLEAAGHDVVSISRSNGVDVVTGGGLAEALEGVDVVIDAATQPTPDERAATDFFLAATRNLQRESERAGVQRIVVVSIIGTDAYSSGYGAAKVVHEQAMQAGAVPATIVRAAQFHEFVGELLDWSTQGEVAYVPTMRTQLVAARTVAEVLAEKATNGGSANVEVAGPREESLAHAATLLAARRGNGVRIEETSDPSDPEQQVYASGALLPGPGAILAGPTFEEWLDLQQFSD